MKIALEFVAQSHYVRKGWVRVKVGRDKILPNDKYIYNFKAMYDGTD